MTRPVGGIDPRGPRFTAAVTLVLLAVALVVPDHTVSAVLVGIQCAFFAVGVLFGVHRTPTGILFRTLIRPRLTPPAELEDPRPPRFAQGLGLVFTAVSLVGYVSGAILLGQVAAGLAVVAALLNAAFGLCLGCELYLLGLRLTRRPA